MCAPPLWFFSAVCLWSCFPQFAPDFLYFLLPQVPTQQDPSLSPSWHPGASWPSFGPGLLRNSD
ncbi:unnamed protein product [Fusarium graminearum]|nr:unnamed protein product [Fusarium graminearum]